MKWGEVSKTCILQDQEGQLFAFAIFTPEDMKKIPRNAKELVML